MGELRCGRAWFGMAMLCLAGCATPAPEGALIADPYESVNREIHEFNVGVDQVLLRPVTYIYDSVTPSLVKFLVSNMVEHIRLPLTFVNEVLQARFEDALTTFGRFGVNTIAGAGGFLDPATEFGLPFNQSDFGMTLARWGAEEGPFVMLPLLGPATVRDAFGRAGDFAIDPFGFVPIGAGGGRVAAEATRVGLTLVDARSNNFELVDDLFYNTEDSYVVIRSLYVQNRRSVIAGNQIDPETLPDIFGEYGD